MNAALDEATKAWQNLQVIAISATSSTVSTVTGASTEAFDKLHGNNIASTTTKAITQISNSIDVICEGIGLQRR